MNLIFIQPRAETILLRWYIFSLLALCFLQIFVSRAAYAQENATSNLNVDDLMTNWIKDCRDARNFEACKIKSREILSETGAKEFNRSLNTKNDVVGFERTYLMLRNSETLVGLTTYRFETTTNASAALRSVLIFDRGLATSLESYSLDGKDFRISSQRERKPPYYGADLDVFAYIPGWSESILKPDWHDCYAVSEVNRDPHNLQCRVDVRRVGSNESGPFGTFPQKPTTFSVRFSERSGWRPEYLNIASELRFNIVLNYADWRETSTGQTLPHQCTVSTTTDRNIWMTNPNKVNYIKEFELFEFSKVSTAEVAEASDPYSYMGVTPITSRPSNSNSILFFGAVLLAIAFVMVLFFRNRAK